MRSMRSGSSSRITTSRASFHPNIWPPEEYGRRLEEARKVEEILDFRLVTERYAPEAWFEMTDRLKSEPERGRRCDVCYAPPARSRGPPGPRPRAAGVHDRHERQPLKKADVVNRIGSRLARKHGLAFLEADFKKKGGFQKSVELSPAPRTVPPELLRLPLQRRDDRT